MREVPGQLPFAKYTPRRAIHFGGSRARANRRDGGLLRFQNSFVQPPSLSRGPSDMHSSRAIRAITGEYNTKIADHEPAPGMRAPEARPCTIAERAPEASIVGKDMPSAPAQRASYSMAAATSTSVTPGRIFLHAILKKTGAEFNRPPDAQDLGSILHHAGTLDQRWRGTQAHPPFQHAG